jgi:hypothetical protein
MILVDFTLLTFFHTLFWPFLRFTATLSHLACQVIGWGPATKRSSLKLDSLSTIFGRFHEMNSSSDVVDSHYSRLHSTWPVPVAPMWALATGIAKPGLGRDAPSLPVAGHQANQTRPGQDRQTRRTLLRMDLIAKAP